MNSLIMVKIILHNARGLQNFEKRKLLMYHLGSKADIICLQETHCANEKEAKKWANMWGVTAYWSNSNSRSAGVVILVRKGCEITIKNWIKDHEGRSVTIQYEDKDEMFVLQNIYGPSDKDNPNFFVKAFKATQHLEGRRIIVGDFNVELDPKLDRKGSGKECKKELIQILNKFVEDAMMQDIWRVRNPESKMFTWQRKKDRNQVEYVASRIDYMLVDTAIASWVSEIKIIPGFRSDHSAVYMDVLPFEITRGRGLWRLNEKRLC